jgi:heme oxygenase
VFEERHDLDIQRLKQETEADHRNVEGAVPLMHQGLNIAGYVQCLQRIYGIVAAWEERARSRPRMASASTAGTAEKVSLRTGPGMVRCQ